MIEFKIELTLITKQTLGFSLFYEEETSIELALPVSVFTDFAIGLGALVWTDIKLTDKQLETLWGLKVNVFDNSDRGTATSVFLKNKDRIATLVDKQK